MAQPMAQPPNTPSWTFCLAAAAPPAAIWCCFLPLTTLIAWLPLSIVVPYMPLPESVPFLSLVHLYASYSACVDALWESWWSLALGTFLLAKAMGLAHESFWDAFEPFIVGREGHGAGVQRPMVHHGHMLDKDDKPTNASN